jgi:hypothetical protein
MDIAQLLSQNVAPARSGVADTITVPIRRAGRH